MSTRSVIARATGEGKFEGRYVHADGFPTSLGAWLWKSLRGHFQNDLHKMLTYLIDAPHAVCGWSGLVDKDLNLIPKYTWQKATADGAKYEVYSKRPDYRRPQCFAGRPGEEPTLFTEKDFENGTDVEWLYAFDEEHRKLFVRDVAAKEDVGVIDLDGEEPNWEIVECGENFERCSHYAWRHKLVPKTCNLSTQTWLERQPLVMRDAVAVEIAGKVLKLTGSGGDSSYLNRTNRQFYPQRKPFPEGCWVATCKYANGRSVELPIARRVGNNYEVLPGVAWIMPPTKNHPASKVTR
jgi:hypothetical protein